MIDNFNWSIETPEAVTHGAKVVISRKLCKIVTSLLQISYSKPEMLCGYSIASFLMSSSDLQGHNLICEPSQVRCFVSCAVADKISTIFLEHRVVPRIELLCSVEHCKLRTQTM